MFICTRRNTVTCRDLLLFCKQCCHYTAGEMSLPVQVLLSLKARKAATDMSSLSLQWEVGPKLSPLLLRLLWTWCCCGNTHMHTHWWTHTWTGLEWHRWEIKAAAQSIRVLLANHNLILDVFTLQDCVCRPVCTCPCVCKYMHCLIILTMSACVGEIFTTLVCQLVSNTPEQSQGFHFILQICSVSSVWLCESSRVLGRSKIWPRVQIMAHTWTKYVLVWKGVGRGNSLWSPTPSPLSDLVIPSFPTVFTLSPYLHSNCN